MGAQTLDGTATARAIKGELTERVAALAERGASEQHRRSWNLGLPGAPAQAPPTLFD